MEKMSYRKALNLFGLKEGYAEDDLKKAYRKKMFINHPDKVSEYYKESALEKSKLIMK